jgi:hypothetical protein
MDAIMDSIKSLEAPLEKFILDPKYHDVLMLVKAVRNGIVYGTKVRFPHALVYATKLPNPLPPSSQVSRSNRYDTTE